MPRQLKETQKKAGRRGNNEGSIYQRKDGRWCAQVTVGYKDDGKRIIKYAYGNTRQEVAKKLSKFTNAVFEGGYSAIAPKDVYMFYAMLEDWYVTFKEPNINSCTSEKLRNYMKNQIKPEVGNLTIQQADTFLFQRLFNNLRKKGLCLQTIKHIKQLLNQFYDQYVIKKGLCRENPLAGVVIRGKERNDAERDSLALTPEQREIVLEKLETEPTLKPIVTVLLLTGMRPGELIALQWRDIQWESKSLSIRLAASREIEFDDDGNVVERRQVVSNTKTVLSVRSFVVADEVIDCLQDWLARQKECEAKKGIILTSPDSYIFCSSKGEIRSYSGLRTLLRRFLEKNGLADSGINLYSFRHTFATMLLEERENPKVVSELMGHAKVLTTLTFYSHVISQTVYKDTANTLSRVYAGLKKRKGQTSHATTRLPKATP